VEDSHVENEAVESDEGLKFLQFRRFLILNSLESEDLLRYNHDSTGNAKQPVGPFKRGDY
jgi:hypothetical protein